jgi:hypothetical protein
MLALVLAAAIAASPASPPTGAAAPPTRVRQVDVNGQAHDPDKIVCRDEEVLGSRMTKRVCRTQAQIDQSSQETQRYLHDLEDRNGLQAPMTSSMGSGGMGGR